MQFRRLVKEELEPLAEDFAIFLASNSIDKKEWDSIKEKDAEKADHLLDIFSDMVFEKALTSAKYLERISETEIHCYSFFAKTAHLISLRYVAKEPFSFFNAEAFNQAPTLLKSGKMELIQGTRTFEKPREAEMFAIMQTGATISKGELYRALVGLI